jgi:arylsulfatase A-like enzyme
VRRRAGVLLAAGVCAVIGGLWWLQPWADSVLAVKITIRTDEQAPVVVYSARKLFSAKSGRVPVLRAEVSLEEWATELVEVAVEGSVRPRAVGEGSVGEVACAAELVAPEGESPFEFVSWQGGADAGLHTRALGPLAWQFEEEGERSFAIAKKGALWRVFRAPEGARLRVWLKPALSVGLTRSAESGAADAGREGEETPEVVARARGRRPDIFIYLIDAVRADHLGCYGYGRGTSPAIDAFAGEATLYEEAHTAATWTRPSVATMLTGMYASAHGAMHEADVLAEWPVLLPEMLDEVGYSTRCITTNGMVAGAFGFDQGYDEFVYVGHGTASWVSEVVRTRLAAEEPDTPVFMFLLTLEPHEPYTPRPESFRVLDRGFEGRYDGSAASMETIDVLRPDLSEADVAHLIDLYDAEIRDADEGFAEFVAALKGAGRYEDSLIVLVSDHGEAFAEHDTFGHGWDLNRETMRVPLVVKFPGGQHAGTRVAERVSLVDIVPTVLGVVDLEVGLSYGLPGEDLSKAMADSASGSSRRVYAEVSRWDSNDLDLVAVIDEDGYKRVMDVSVPPRENAPERSIGLWDTRADPMEERDLSRELPVRARYGEQLIAEWLVEQSGGGGGAAAARPKVEIDEDMRRELQDLGYLKGRSSPAD